MWLVPDRLAEAKLVEMQLRNEIKEMFNIIVINKQSSLDLIT